jgi:hypothetical protein
MPSRLRTVRCATGTGRIVPDRRDPPPREDQREEQRPLHHREPRPGADARPGRERQERARAGSRPHPPAPSGRGRSRGDRPRAARCGADARATGRPACPAPRRGRGAGPPRRLPHHHRHGRIEPQRLAEHVAREAQPRETRESVAAAKGPRLRRHPRLRLGMRGEKVERPGQRRGRGLVPRKEEDRHLVDHLLGRTARPVTGSRVVMIRVARSSGACPPRSPPPPRRQFRDPRPDAPAPPRAPPARARAAPRPAAAGRRPVQERLRPLEGAEVAWIAAASGSSIGIENITRKIASAAMWLAIASTSTSPSIRATPPAPPPEAPGRPPAPARPRRPGR